MKHLKQSQKLRVILNGVAVYTTAKQVRGCLFGFMSQNVAAQKALDSLESMRVTDPAVGLVGTWEGLQVQIDML
jgi:hypothetical protein